MDPIRFNELLAQAAADPENARTPENWRQLLTTTRELSETIEFRKHFQRRKSDRLDCHMNFYAPLGTFKPNGKFSVSVRLSGLDVGTITANQNKKGNKVFTPKFPKRENIKTIFQNAWNAKTKEETSREWNSPKVYEYLSKLAAARATGELRDEQREHWAESELLLLLNNQQARRYGIKAHRCPLKGMSHMGLGKSEQNKFPFQMSVPIVFNCDDKEILRRYPEGYPKPSRSYSGGHVDALAYRKGEIQIWEVKDPRLASNNGVDKDAWQAICQAYAYTLYLATYGADPLRHLTPIKTTNIKFKAVAVVPNNENLITALKKDWRTISEYEQKQHRNIELGILSYSGENFLANREITDLKWEIL